MKKLMTFSRGGIHPRKTMIDTSTSPIRNAPMPTRVLVPFSQHIGIPAKPLVSVGEHLDETQLIGEPMGFMSSAVHSPIPGDVKEFRTIYLPSGVKTEAVLIELSGEFIRSGKHVSHRDWELYSKEEIIDILKRNGVVGQGGATFPTHVKYTIPKGRKFEVFLVNAAECEPYLSGDHRLMLECTDDLIEGIRIARKVLSPERVIVGIESNKRDAIELLTEFGKKYNIEVVALKVKYPQGAEKNLIEAILGREVPSGKLPIEVGVINSNVGTLVSICQAVRDDRPVIDRVVTVSGAAVRNPGNLLVRIGTPVHEIIDECGGLVEEPCKFISGGPMMGFSFSNLDTPVTKGTSGILTLTHREVHELAQTACLSCGKCIEVCPMGLSPTVIFKNIEYERLDGAAKEGLDDCVLCGACAYICPAHIPLVSAFRAARSRRRRLSSRVKG